MEHEEKKVRGSKRGRAWKYERKDVREDVETQMPDNWKLEVWLVTSGDSGDQYWIQVLTESLTGKTTPLYLCDCPQGKFKAPLSVVGLGPQCKHAINLAAVRQQR